jgi:sugar lactone lactonase YvrE
VFALGAAACGGNVVVDGGLGTGPSTSSSSSSSSGASLGSWPTSGGGACGDTTSDPHNCGMCGHDCLGGACVQGSCQPVVLASNGYPNAITLNTTALYWSDLVSGIMRLPLGTMTPTMIASANAPEGVALDNTFVYWTAKDGVARAPLAGGPVSMLYSGAVASGPWGIAVDTAHVYWTDKTANTLLAVPLAGGALKVLAKGLSSPDGVVVDSATVYLADGTNQQVNGDILRVPTTGAGAQSTLAPDQKGPRALALDAVSLYWTDSAPFYPSPTGLIMKVSKAGGMPVKIADAQGDPLGLAVDDTYVYWVNGDVGTIVRAPKDGGLSEVLAGGQTYVTAIAIDDNAIYWTTQAQGGTVVLLAK